MRIKFLSVFLSLFACLALVGASTVEPTLKNVVYTSGTDGYHTFRIPALAVSNRGTLLAFAEGRRNSRSDTGDINLLLKRSTDGGKSWSDMITVWDDQENVCGNPCVVVDRTTGRIILLSTWNLGTDNEKVINARTAKNTRRVFVLHSDDDGLTWSAAREITASTKKPEWTWYATGPGHAIQLQNGEHAGRLVVPCDYGEYSENGVIYHSHLIYSDDGGQNWTISAQSEAGGNESTVVELSTGDLMLNMRGGRDDQREKRGSCRGVAISKDAGLSLAPTYFDRTLIEPVCQGSIVNYAPKGKLSKTLLFSNPDSKSVRISLTVKISHDNGRTWRDSYRVNDRYTAYSDMVVLDNGDVAVFYEDGMKTSYDQISFQIIPAKVFKK